MLIILDNCEHVVDACAKLADTLLRHCSEVHLLATSREPLGVDGELVYRVPSLLLPEEDEESAIRELRTFGAIRLFVERARTHDGTFLLDESNAKAVLSICRQVDGIALAIELAAARLRSMSIGSIEERLHDRFRLLTGGNRSNLPRQQTLRALIDWSYNLLVDQEQTVLRRLSTSSAASISKPPNRSAHETTSTSLTCSIL